MTDELLQNFGHATWLSFPVIAARLFVAAIFGAAIGMEREWRNQPAGLRTHILISVATAAIAVLTIEITHSGDFDRGEIRMDPLRLIEATTAGIAFLAAGMIIFAQGRVHGLTTGAGMWLTGAVGMCVGLGYWQIGLFATVIAVIVLSVLQLAESREPDRSGETPDRAVPADRKKRDP